MIGFPGASTPVPTATAIDDALKMFIADQVVVFNDRARLMLHFGEYKARPKAGGLVSAVLEKGDMDSLQIRLQRLTLLVSTCRAIIWLTSSPNARADLHFPALRAKIPYATALVLSLVGSADDPIDSEGKMTLAAFTELYGYLEGWKLV